jgi:hypothetical protein
VASRHRALAIAILIGSTALCGVGVLGAWVDHLGYLQTPPGRETIPVLGFLTAIVAWLGSILMLVSALVGKARFWACSGATDRA